MKAFIEKILNEYIPAKQETFAGHSMGMFFRSEIPQRIYNTGIVNQQTHLITGSVGQGNWATVPWVCIFDKKITTSATRGVYIVYLLSKDGQTLYLTFNQGCTDIRNSHTKKETIDIMRKRAAEIAAKIDSRGFLADEAPSLGNGLTELAELYQRGIIFYKAYKRGMVPDEPVLRDDLQKMMGIYADYVATLKDEDWWPSKSEYDPGLTKETWYKLLAETDVLGDNIRRMLAAMYVQGGAASCAQLAETYGKTASHYIMTAVHAAERTSKATGCPIMDGAEDSKFWPVMFVGRKEPRTDRYIWKIRDELFAALKEYGIEQYLPEQTGVTLGKFDSWEIVDENTAIKHCDKSFFEHNGSGIPKGICWFFEAEGMAAAVSKNITLMYDGQAYPGRISNDSSDRRRFRIFWNVQLGRMLEGYKNKDAMAIFKKAGVDCYTLEMKVGEMEMTIKEKVAMIKTYIAARGFSYEGDLIENFYLSLKSKPFVILAGTSGTGKTRLVKLFAEAIGAKMKLVPVRPDWSDSSDLFGHTDLSNRFHPGAIIDFVKQAEQNIDVPHFLCLDEMNLARVEYYLSDFLSVIETRDRKENGAIETDPLVDVDYFKDEEAREKYGRVFLPENLYIIGTVNMDETTFPFSKKVLDRANTIEFSFVDLTSKATAAGDAVAQELDNSFLKTEYLYFTECGESDLVDDVCLTLEEMNQILVKANLHVGYRVRDEISFYMLNNKNADLLLEDAAFDHEIMQKILPRVQGSSAAIKEALIELFVKCAGDYTGFAGNTTFEQMDSYIRSKTCKYPNSAKKIAFMTRRFEEDGFTSYWL